ncbi:cytochrome P450 [Guyanagaster necrorhizus]|uniref:Cytochrome P450 n=1 Tax=Guyanagaster necrorhizus TaxID=856835 RepID=A0A9P7W6R6_9AGAR|nr:cytochrome P450 [Guyanagaster necrorhizus MCA 3950]KAG7453207.1 cytochrome P450 [Guyanagaster necrorhizus MCA 3950]
MHRTSNYLLLSVIVYFLIAVALRLRKRRSAIRRIRGPPRPSFLLGHEALLRNREHVGDLEMEWYQQYGAVYRTGGCFGQDILFVADPKALQYIFHSSGYRFPKTRDIHRINEAFVGPGVATVEGDIHRRQRKILGPAFAASQLQLFLTIFQESAMKLTEKINERVGDARVLNVLEWTSKAALDIIGITSFRYYFNSLNDGQTELTAALRNVFGEAQMWPTTWELLFPALWRILPKWLLLLLEQLPSRDTVRMKRFRDTATKVSRPIFEKQLTEVANDANPAEKDVVNVLAMSYLSDDTKKKMSDIEIDSQLATFVLAGHDTTANTMAWLLYELSRHPDDQAKIREEIAIAKANAPRSLTSSDYDSMPWLNATIKEVLRYHPLAYGLFRESAQDDILPLAEPIITSNGDACSEIPTSKGQVIFASVYTYNRLPSVWGDDAAEWNPRRFLGDRGIKQESLGVYANLLTFSAGIRGCLGWRFAVMELQSVVTELLSNFEFSISKGAPELQHGPAGFVLIPIVPGKAKEGPQIPLLVTPLKK